jgi:hypothetical protein
MLTRFISDKSYDTVDITYPQDSDVKFENFNVGVDGNLNYTALPILSDAKDLKINNYVLNIISKNDKLSNLISLDQENKIKNKMCYFYSSSSIYIDDSSRYWKFDSNFISVSTNYNNYNEKNIFEIDFIDNEKCKIYHNEDTLKYILAYSIALSSVKSVPLTANNFENYTTIFNYNLTDENKIILYVKTNLGNYSLKKQNSKLIISPNNNIVKDNFFYIKKITNLNESLLQNNWLSYDTNFNKNNLEIESEKSHFDVKNNFLLTTTINAISSATLPINLLTLKNQLNQENEQSRGNVFLNENETNLKEYESIFTGGYREFGYDKINLGFTSYSTPFTFKSGKTTYFHVPHDIYPYKTLNINSSKLVESGAIGGNSPLNSDKIWKKLRNYRETSPYSDPQEEHSGQWLCTWLSAGNDPRIKPIWMDRYYKPSKTTPFLALSAISTEIVYVDGFNCLDLKDNVSDVKSSLTFEKGCYYAYMHLGRNDYLNLITESISAKIHYTELNEYQNTNFKDLDPVKNTYHFDGKSYGYIDSEKKFDYNIVTFSFFAEKDNWEIPSGNMIFGNYVDKGFGFYNYLLNTPYLILKTDNNNLQILNNDLKEIDKLSTENLTLCGIAGISRRNGFDNIHIITNDFKLIEIDLKGTVVDSNNTIVNTLSLKASDKIFSITNDKNNCYVHTSSGVAAIDLYSNIVKSKPIKRNITTTYTTSSYIVADDKENVYRFYGRQPIFRNDNIYAMDDTNKLFSYSTTLSTLSTYIETQGNIRCFNIDSNDSINAVTTNNKLYEYKGNVLVNTIDLPLLSTYSLSARVFNFCEKFEYGELKKYKQIYCTDRLTNDPYILQIDENYNQKLLKFNKKYSRIQPNLDLTGYNFNRGYIQKEYGDNNYNFKVKLLNRVNDEDYIELNFIIKSYHLGTGLRHFVFSIDTYNGIGDLYLDGVLYERINFEGKKYTLSNTFNGRIYYGSNGYHNGTLALKYFKDIKDFTYSNIKISDIFIINKALNRFESLYFYNLVYPSNDIKYNMPSGTRSFIDKIERTFNFNIPMFKSNYFNLKILNSGIKYDDIRKDIESEIRNKVSEYLPFYSKLNNFDWLDTVSTDVVIEGDYNVSNTLTDI